MSADPDDTKTRDTSGDAEGQGDQATRAASRDTTPGAGPDSETSPAANDPVAHKWLKPLGLALSGAAIALLVVIVLFAVKLTSAQAQESRRADALAAGRQAAVNLTSFNFQTAVEDVQRLQASTTLNFQDQFNRDQNAFIKLIRDGQVRSAGTATEAGVVRYEGETARILVAMKASVQNTSLQQPEKRDYRMAINMVDQNGKWLADSVEFIP
jgi:Mce-associated membrane protein